MSGSGGAFPGGPAGGGPGREANWMEEQKEAVRERFTKQAALFSRAPSTRDEEALRLHLEAAGARPEDTVLDVACGPGVVVCAFAEVTRYALGIDLVPAMLERAQALQKEKGLANVSWEVGDAAMLPYPDGAFSIVTSRYSFHHMSDPAGALAEMTRVCRPGGKVVLIDVMVSEDPGQAERFNRMERLRDPSHVRTMPLSEMKELYRRVGLTEPETRIYPLELELESFLQRSFTPEDGAAEVRKAFLDDSPENGLGLEVRREGSEVRFSFPIALLAGEKRGGHKEASLR